MNACCSCYLISSSCASDSSVNPPTCIFQLKQNLGHNNEQPEKIPLYHSTFCVRIKHLPFNYRLDEDFKEVVANWGEIMKVEEHVLDLNRFRPVKVVINVTKPLR